MNAQPAAKPLKVFLIAGEASADVLGAAVMRALKGLRQGGASFSGLGGPAMAAEGLVLTGRLDDLTTIGLGAILTKLYAIWQRLRDTVDAVVAAKPDVLVLIDAPEFTLRVAARVRRRLPDLPIVKYVSPTVWIWRPGRARAMRPCVDLILGVLPFEPEVHRQLGGPPCTYVGHPLLERLAEMRPGTGEGAATGAPLVLALPGSRGQELRRLMPAFGEALGLLAARSGPIEVVLPTLPDREAQVRELAASWPLAPRIVTREAEKHAAFRSARAALAASGTVTLELALAGVPTVAAYRLPLLEYWLIRSLVRVHPVVGTRSAILPNLVLGEHAIPELLQYECTPANLAAALGDLIADTPQRRKQVDALKRLDGILGAGGEAPSTRAARAVLDLVEQKGVSPA
jgi:lipid-A-disaccharide synthase